ncbi:MAG: hypothetical protein R6U96_14625 [Promethearchaeia archaeon]
MSYKEQLKAELKRREQIKQKRQKEAKKKEKKKKECQWCGEQFIRLSTHLPHCPQSPYNKEGKDIKDPITPSKIISEVKSFLKEKDNVDWNYIEKVLTTDTSHNYKYLRRKLKDFVEILIAMRRIE